MSKGERVVVDGRLKGMNRDIPCQVSGIQVSDTTVFEMTEIGIVDPPKDLPDGIYELDFEGSGERFTKRGDVWEIL